MAFCFSDEIINWYIKGHRDFPWRHTKDPYHIWISEIMLQQTRAETVVSYYNRFTASFPNVFELAKSDEETLLKAWEGLGYYSRAKNLKKCAQIIVERYDGSFPSEYGALLQLPGIGPYTAGAIASIAFDNREPAVDGNVLRVMSRFYGIEEDIHEKKTQDGIRRRVYDLLPEQHCDLFSNAMMEIGACICTPKIAKCQECPLNEECVARIEEKQTILPVKNHKIEKRKEKKEILLIFSQNKVYIEKRKKGLLSGLYGFPEFNGPMSPDEIEFKTEQLGINAKYLEQIGMTKHVFTHVIWEMRIHVMYCRDEKVLTGFVNRSELLKVPIPIAFRKARQLCLARMK